MGTLDTMRPTDAPAEAHWPGADALDAAMDAEAGVPAAPGRVNRGMLLLGGAVLIAVATLFVMRRTGATSVDGTLSAVELQIEKALAQMGGGQTAEAGDVGLLMRNTDEVIAVFAHNPAEKQVQLAQLSKNPFATHLAGGGGLADDPQAPPSLEAQQRDRRVAALRDELSRLRLQTVVEGRTPMAVISGKVVKTRDQLGSFRVALIESRRVILAAEGNTYQLSMRGPAMSGG